MASLRTTDPKFLATVEAWLEHRHEILVLIRYTESVGAKGFEFISSYQSLMDQLRTLPPLTSVIAFRQPQLPFRGVVDDDFITRCVEGIPDDAEYLVLETVKRVQGRNSWFLEYAGITRAELRDDLEESRGIPVAAGLYPAWHEDNDDIISAVVPDEHGSIKPPPHKHEHKTK